MNNNPRIGLGDGGLSAVMKLSEGNPGAITVMAKLMQEEARIDPDHFMTLSGLAYIMTLDTFGIYGSNIWGFYKDVCQENVANMIAVMRACQLGKIRESEIHQAIQDSYSNKLTGKLQEIMSMVQEELPNFNKQAH